MSIAEHLLGPGFDLTKKKKVGKSVRQAQVAITECSRPDSFNSRD